MQDAFAAVIARHVAELLRAPADQDGAWIDAAEVARRHAVSRGWVYAHAQQLGAVRLGTGDRPRLRFDPAVVRQRLEALAPAQLPPTTSIPKLRKGRSRHFPQENLLPIKGGQRAGKAA